MCAHMCVHVCECVCACMCEYSTANQHFSFLFKYCDSPKVVTLRFTSRSSCPYSK